MNRTNPLSHHRRRLSLPPAGDNLDLFPTTTRRSLSRDPDVSLKMPTPLNTGFDDFLSSPDGGKHDYDWLLTPPGTPLAPFSNGNDSQVGPTASRSGPFVRSISTSKASRLSVSQSDKNHAAKPTRSSSVTRPSVSSSQYSTYSNKSTSILNTSSASVSSYIRPSTRTSRSSSITRPSTPSTRPTVSRSTTPSKPRPALSTSSSIEKPRPSQNSRPSTPTSRPQVSAHLNSPSHRTTSRSSTPTRRNPTPSISPVSVPSTPGGRSLTNGRSVASVSRPSSPASRVRPPPQPIVPTDFPLDTPPNLRTTLPDRPLSAGRSRPGATLTSKGNVEPTSNTANVLRRQSSPVAARGRVSEPTGRGRTLSNGQLSDRIDSWKELPTRKTVKTSTDSTGFGRTISKKSLDMAIRHMDIRNGSSAHRPLTSTNLFPQSIRSSNQKTHASVNGSVLPAENGKQLSETGSDEERCQSLARVNGIDIYESSRYDMILLKEDVKNTNWLHSIDDKSEQGSIFDNGFEHLPEPFDPLQPCDDVGL